MERILSRRSTFSRALADFAAKTHEFTMEAVDGRPYVLVERLQKWMRDHTKLDNKFVTNTDLLAHAAYYGRSDFPPIASSRISEPGHDCCVIVFSILLDLELGHLIDLFSRKTIVDRRLPEDLSSLTKKLKGLENGEEVAESFNERQWKFCPAIFSMNMENEYFENRIVPICRKTHLNSGGTAKVWQIAIQEDFVDKNLRNQFETDAEICYNDKDYGRCYIFALKTFEEGNFRYYEDEKAAFDGLRHNRGVIRRLGCYSHRLLSPSPSTTPRMNGGSQAMEANDTMNLLLEYGTYDLRLIFGHQTPPVLPGEIIVFWEALFEVADAVRGIHEFKNGGSEFNGWHADIKPENIICVRGKYKLADPGFARFKRKAKDKTVPRTRLDGGTDTYGAPEVSSQAGVHQTIDIWSLGCVFSMAATWIVLGYQGVMQYQFLREKALGGLLKSIKQDNHPLLVSQRLTTSAKPEKLDCFHNGTEVLQEVLDWHLFLRKSARKPDPITEQVLGLIDQSMLKDDPHSRVASEKLCAELKRIVGSAKNAVRDALSAETPEARDRWSHFKGLLNEIEKEATARTVEEVPAKPTNPFTAGLPVDRDALKAQLDHVALKKTSHRYDHQDTIPGPRPKPNVPQTISEQPAIKASDTMGTRDILYRTDTQDQLLGMSPAEKRMSFRRSTFDRTSRANTGATQLTSRRAPSDSSTHAPQNAIQVREGMGRDLKQKNATFGGLGRLQKKRLKKDAYLSNFFKDRDIKFLVDDAESMAEYWDEATFLLETLVMKSHGQDPDGPDLTFAHNQAELRKEKEASAFRRKMEEAQPNIEDRVHTNIKIALEPIFNSYLSMVTRTNDKSRVNALTVIILTDGLWKGMGDHNEIIPKILDFYQKLKKKMDGMMQERQVSIQFIQFGDDEEARERLRRLDDDMPYHGVDDMIDFEKFSITGDVFKMLLGSFVEEMDAMNDSVEDLPFEDSPPSHPTMPNPTRTLPNPMQPIPEGSQEAIPTIVGRAYDTLPAPSTPTPQKSKKSRLSKFISGI